MRLYIPIALALGLILWGSSGEVQAFSSFEIFGGAYHQEIAREALKPLGFSDRSLRYIDQGLLEPDKFYRDKFTDSGHHFTEMDFQGSLDYLFSREKAILKRSAEAVQDYQEYRETLFLFGGYLHTTQDFYAHTNWIERTLAAGIKEIAQTPLRSASEFEDLVCPYFLYTRLPAREITDIAAYEKEFKTAFYDWEELDSLTDRQRILLAAEPKQAFTHKALAKDNPEYPQGALKWVEDGPTLFEMARQVAILDTAHRWEILAEDIDEGARTVLLEGWAWDLPEVEDPTPLKISTARVEVGPDLTFRAELVFSTEIWSRASAEEAIRIFHKLISDQVHPRWNRKLGIQKLHLVKVPADNAFRMSLEADLHGGQMTFLRALPAGEDLAGEWSLEVILPPAHTATEIRVESSGRVSPSGKNSFRLSPPPDGWQLPDWVGEYVKDPKPAP